jgi:hypothetical protein
MFVTYCLDAQVQKFCSGFRHTFRAHFINDDAFDNTLMVSMNAREYGLPVTPHTRLPCTYIRHVTIYNPQEYFALDFDEIEASYCDNGRLILHY